VFFEYSYSIPGTDERTLKKACKTWGIVWIKFERLDNQRWTCIIGLDIKTGALRGILG
jgi:hypothetical protein